MNNNIASYKVVPMHSSAVKSVRDTMISPFGNLPAWSSVATGYGPCRSCLRAFREGEEQRIYITYNPFDGISDLPLPGPVFIHTEYCKEYAADGFPLELLDIPMILEGYGDKSRLVASVAVKTDTLEQQIADVLSTPGVNFIHVRNREAGCFIARVEKRACNT